MQLRDEFEQRTGEVWPLNVEQVYTTLQRLERDGLIESDGEDDAGPQKSFRITTDGTTELETWLRTPPDLSSPPRDELVIKVLVAIRVPGLEVVELDPRRRPELVHTSRRATRRRPGDLGPPHSRAGTRPGLDQIATPYVATPALLTLYRIRAGDIAAGSVILSARRDLAGSSSARVSKGTSSPSWCRCPRCCRTTPRRPTR